MNSKWEAALCVDITMLIALICDWVEISIIWQGLVW